MSGNGTPGFGREDERDLRDPALHRALAHAPDSGATPDPRTRDAILKMAHNLAATVPAAQNAAANSAIAAPWWRRIFGGGEPRSRMPWNAAFATVLLATFVTVLWHREPVPDAQLDGEARVGGGAAPAASSPPVAPPPPAPSAAPAEPSAKPEAPAAAAPQPAPPPAAAPSRKAPAAEQKQAQPQAQRDASSTQPPTAPAPALPPAIVAEQAPPARSDERQAERTESERRRADVAQAPPPPPMPAPIAPAAPAAVPPPNQRESSGSADASGMLRIPAPRAAAAPNKALARAERPAAFAALDQWTSFGLSGAGADVRHARGDIEGLPALVGTVARSATAPDEALAAPVEARLSLYRASTLVAVLEIAGGQVRWTPQPGGTALVGTPPAQALDALRSLLQR